MSRSYTLRTLVLCTLALTLLAGTAGAQTIVAGTTTASFTFANGAAAPAQQTSAISDSGSGDTYTAGVVYTSGNNWLTISAGGAIPSSLTMNINGGVASGMAAGSYSATITATDSNDSSTATITVTLTVAPPIGASGGQTSGAPVAFNFTKGSTTANQTVAVEDGLTSTNTYTVGTPAYGSGATGWLGAAGGTLIANGDTLTLSIVSSALASTPAGAYTATVLLTDSDTSTTTVYVKVTVASPLSASSPTAALTYSQTGTGPQAAAQYVLAVSSSDASADAYTITKSVGCPSWFSATAGSGTASSTAPDAVTMKITSAAGSLPLPVTPVTTCTVTLKYQGGSFSTVTFSSLSVVAAGLASSSSTVALSYVKGGGGTNSQSINITSPVTGGIAFAANVATVPAWLTLSPSSGTASSVATPVSFALSTGVTATMAVGNYTASVHFVSAGYSELVVGVNLGISNTGATLSMKEGASGDTVTGFYAVGATNPAPTVTPFSSNEPLPFTASCAVAVQNSSYTSTASSCLLNGSQATSGSPLVAVAYTWGYPLAVTMDSALFAFPVGTIVTVTMTVTPTGGASNTPMTLAYQYTIVMPAPTLPTSGAVVPTSVAQQTVVGTSMVVVLNGNNFVGPQSIVGGVVSPTLVFLGSGSSTPVSGSQITVVSSHQIMLTIPQASFPTVPGGKTSVNLAIGLANQTGASTPTAATATTNLVVTNAPVIYAITSTASYNNGGLGVAPGLAPYELVSIFGDNFGYAALSPNFATATVNAQDQVPTSLLITTTGSGATAKSTFLTVSFKDASGRTAVSFPAPILFANQNQINAIVPSGLTVGHTINVSVTSGATTNVSDGLYTVNIVGNDPGIFTVASDGTGQGAILNVNGTTGALTVNSATNRAAVGQTVAIYMTGLGAPDSTHPDVALSTPDLTPFPTDCSIISAASTTAPGYMQVGNTAKNTIAGWTPPTTAWTSIDGAVIQGVLLKTNILAPCMIDPITVTFGSGGSAKTATVANGGVTYAGFAAGSIAGLYQINVTIPSGTTTGAAVPVTVTITPSSTGFPSQAGVTMAIQ